MRGAAIRVSSRLLGVIIATDRYGRIFTRGEDESGIGQSRGIGFAIEAPGGSYRFRRLEVPRALGAF